MEYKIYDVNSASGEGNVGLKILMYKNGEKIGSILVTKNYLQDIISEKSYYKGASVILDIEIADKYRSDKNYELLLRKTIDILRKEGFRYLIIDYNIDEEPLTGDYFMDLPYLLVALKTLGFKLSKESKGLKFKTIDIPKIQYYLEL